ncbi:MAG: NAD-dependent epimerase, partial [Sinomicrobium sp.]|nr:NAD-dependent epimerase [Sinomicrobium sp.]
MEVWRGVQEGLQAVMVNPGVILGAGFPESGSGKLFTAVKNGFPYYTEGVTGFVAVEDVTEAMIRLMQSPVSGERYILAAENLSYKALLTTIAKALAVTPPEKAAKPRTLNTLRWLHWLKHRLTGKPISLTKYTITSAFSVNRYSSARIKEALHFEFTPITVAIKNI